MAREVKNKKLKFKYSVLGDGQTEQYYLEHLKKIEGYGYSIRPRFFNKISIAEADAIITELLDGGMNKIIYLTDFDTVASGKTKKEYTKLRAKYKKVEEVLICETMPSIEFWFLLHYQYTTRLFRNAGEAEKALKKYVSKYNKSKAFLENDKWVTDLIAEGKQHTAIENAERLIVEKEGGDKDSHFPYTKVHIAIREFDRLKAKRQ